MYPKDNKRSFAPDSNGEVIISQTLIEKRRQSKKMSAYYSFLTVVLIFCLIQMTWSAVINISKVVSYRQKIFVMKNTKDKVISKNNQLKTELNNVSTSSSWEAIARNNLKMAGDNEILVVIDDNNSSAQQNVNTKNGNTKNGKHN